MHVFSKTLLYFMAVSLPGLSLSAAPSCSLATLKGNFGFIINGQVLSGPSAGPVAGVAMTTYDGAGNLTQVDNVVHNGQLPAEAWRPATGSYTLNSNCTGTMQLVFTDGSPTMNLAIVVDASGNQIRTVVDSDSAINSTGVKSSN